tara:strand:+ start:3709 stop:4764 length:1056 start_codon:yes stop_codon:yes gene_type:complete
MIYKFLITVPTLNPGGMERAAANCALALHKLGHGVKIFTVSNNFIYFDLPEEIEVISGKNKSENLWLIPLSLYKLRKLSQNFRPNFVLSFSGRMSSYIIITLMGLNIPVIPFHRGNPNIIYGRLNNVLNMILYPKCKALVVQTKKAKEIFEKKYKNKNVIVMPNPIRELKIDETIEKEKILINISRLVKGKGLDNLIRIFSNINSDEWSLHILGDGPLRNSLEDLAEELKINHKVKFMGFQKNVDVYLSKASVFAFTSESEGFPNALLEAMCSGLACISFDCPTGPSEMIIDGENGFLIDLFNHQEYSDKLEYLLNHNSLRTKFSNEAKKLNEKHNPDKILNEFITRIEKI